MINFIYEDFDTRASYGGNKPLQILYLLPDYKNVDEVCSRILTHKSDDKLITPYVFRGKTGMKDGERLCIKVRDKYVPGCKNCDNTGDCLWVAQFKQIKHEDVIVTVHHCAYIALKQHFRTIIIDESIEGVLFNTFDYSEKRWKNFGIEWDNFPEPVKRKCRRTCPVYKICRKHRPNKECLEHSDILIMRPTVTRKSESDEEFFLHYIFRNPDVEILGAWDFYTKEPKVAVFNFLPELKCDEMFYNSATTTKDMLTDWFFKNYVNWDLKIDYNKPPYPNPIVTYKNIGSIKTAKRALENGIFNRIRNEYSIPKKKKGLIVVKKRDVKAFREKLRGQNITVDYFPLVGRDEYKNVDFIILALRFRYEVTTNYLLAERFGYQIVKMIEDGYIIQALGRLRIGDTKPWLDPNKLLIVYFDFTHKLFPNNKQNRILSTEKWIRRKLTEDIGYTGKILYKLGKDENIRYLERNYQLFYRIYTRIKNKFRSDYHKEIRDWIGKHPDLSARQTYLLFQKTDFKLGQNAFFRLFKKSRGVS